MSNSEIKIEDLLEKLDIEDDNLIIVEDEEDTKKAHVLELKKAFSGDYSDPELYKFYSSSKISEFLNSINIQVSSLASQRDLDELRNILNSIVTSNPDGTKDNEIIEARGSADSLSGRFDLERLVSDDRYLQYLQKSIIMPTYSYTIDGNHKGFVEYMLIQGTESTMRRRAASTEIGVAISKNFIQSKGSNTTNSAMTVDSDNNGFIYNQSSSNRVVTLNAFNPYAYSAMTNSGFGIVSTDGYILAAGDYYLYTDVAFSDNFIDRTNVSFLINYTDASIDTLQYNHEPVFKFTAKKSFNAIYIQYNENNLVDGATATYRNVMLSPRGDLDTYVKYVVLPIITGEILMYTEEVAQSSIYMRSSANNTEINTYDTTTVTTSSNYGIIYNDDYIFIDTIGGMGEPTTVQLTYYDHSIDTEYIVDKLSSLEESVEDEIDQCGLIIDRGVYQFFTDYSITSYPESMTVEECEEEYHRNGMGSVKIRINNNATTNPTIKQAITATLDNVESVTLCFYMDKTVFSNFTDADGLRVYISSDDPSVTVTNYYTYTIGKAEMVQGWNFVKHPLSEFIRYGNPNARNIKSVSVEIGRNDNLNGQILYLNCAIFNQKMKPTVILTFDGTYDDSISYLYPYMVARNIPASLLLSSARTLTAAAFDYIIGLRVSHGWDIGMYGCNPNRELLIQDDNYRNQYIALRNSKAWVQDNMVENPISYSAPYGNLRPITVPLLKDMGFKIARTDGSGYISNFSDKDFAISVKLISNLTASDQLKSDIDYAINNNMALCLYTRDVTEYGSEADSTQLMFESVVNYIMEKRNNGELQCLTMSDFYHRCTGK